METQFTIRYASQSDLTALIELGRTYYPATHPALNQDFLKWFYLQNPYGAARLICAEEADKIIGVIALIPIMLEQANNLQKAFFAVNVLTHPQHRSKNLFIKMIRYAREQLIKDGAWLIGHPNSNAIPGWKRQKMEFRDALRPYITKVTLPFSGIEETRITSLQDLKTLPANLWDQNSRRPDIHIHYSAEYINWRYLEAPHRDYIVLSVKKSEEFLGLKIIRLFKWPFYLMVDFLWTHEATPLLLSQCKRPVLLMHSGLGEVGRAVQASCWTLPMKRRVSFFVSTWDKGHVYDMNGITLGASDF